MMNKNTGWYVQYAFAHGGVTTPIEEHYLGVDDKNQETKARSAAGKFLRKKAAGSQFKISTAFLVYKAKDLMS